MSVMRLFPSIIKSGLRFWVLSSALPYCVCHEFSSIYFTYLSFTVHACRRKAVSSDSNFASRVGIVFTMSSFPRVGLFFLPCHQTNCPVLCVLDNLTPTTVRLIARGGGSSGGSLSGRENVTSPPSTLANDALQRP